ncbi:hypothetical protein AAG570_008267 [Ranatra chinensis]|uniref:Down syndrome cell adhesion molecule-like protein Dscam2 n=1 Tax=Ranatra chinensis TaxID=642074 RepID=A0ABD0XUN2_9HEMI
MLPTGELLVRRVDDADVYRSYQCRAINRLTGDTLLSPQRVRFFVTDSVVQTAPRIAELPATVHVKKDQTAVLPCFAQGNPSPTYKWSRKVGESVVDVRVSGRVVSAGENLIIERTHPSDAGIWTCFANNSAGQQRKTTNLQVGIPLAVSLQPSGQVVVDVGVRLELNCIVTGGHNRVISWLKDANPVIPTTTQPDLLISGSMEKLVINRVIREDAGMYQCLVRDEETSIQGSVQLILGAAQPQLVYKFIQQTVQPGPAVSLKCIATGNPTPQITWTIDGYRLPQNERFVIGQYVTPHGDVISHVNISNVHVEDGGIYQCKASNRVGDTAHQAEMRVYGLPYIRPMPNVSAVAGEPLFISCPVAGYPIDSIVWEKDGKRLPTNRRQKIFPNGTLYINNVEREQDRGSYRCTAQNKQGKAASQIFSLSVIVPPKIAPFVLQSDLHVGDRVGVQCFVTKGDLPLHLGWEKDSNTLPSDVVIRQYGQYTSSLSINSLTQEHAGNYTCVATNDASTTKYTAELLVNVPPYWVSEPKDVNVTKDGIAKFDCIADGFPAPQISWRKVIGQQVNDYQDISTGRRGYFLYENGTLIINPSSEEHEGHYLCEAANGIGSGISATVMLNVHNPPEFEMLSTQESVRRGQSQTLRCEVHGDQPLTVTWTKHSSLQFNPRYETRERQVRGGIVSELIIGNSIKSDSGEYTCIATNPFGTAQQTVSLQVQDAPGKPLDVRIIDTTSRNIKLSWLPPADEQTTNLQYTVQYKSIISEEWESVNVGNENHYTINNLSPASVYSVRVLAENQLGAGEPCDIIQVTTDMEVPSGEPQGLTVVTTSSSELTVSWLPPHGHSHNGELLGYYIGIREYSGGTSASFNFTTVSASVTGGTVVLSGLHPYRKYGVVAQAFNQKGPGTMTPEYIAHTMEDVPSSPPLNVHCSAQSSQSILVSWKPVPLSSQNGRIQGYRIYYENMIENSQGDIEAETKLTTELSTELHGLQKYSNYSIHVWAFTKIGDGIKSKAIFCVTEEDVPGTPANIKVMSTSSSSLTVSWTPPFQPNGKITGYCIYWKSLDGGKERDSSKKRIPPTQTHFQLNQLSKSGTYEVWVTAYTKVGEGQSTHPVYATPSNRGAAGIISFGGEVRVRGGDPVTLACLVVGQPAPSRTWGPLPFPQSTQTLPDGSIYINNVQRYHQRNYTCSAVNPAGNDQITYLVRVIVPPEAPTLIVTNTGSHWLEIHWSTTDNGGSAIRGYLLEHAASYQLLQWIEERLPRGKNSHKLISLVCGTQYHIRLRAYNSAGIGKTTDVISSRTDGGKPRKPGYTEFLQVNSSTISLHLNSWSNNGCPITSFSIEYKELPQSDWLTVGNDIKPKDRYDIVGLWPGRKYKIRVKAVNSAGSTIAEYAVSTMHTLGVTLSPNSVKILSEESSIYLEPTVMLPVTATLLTVISIGAAITICFRRSENGSRRNLQHQDTQAMVALDNKTNLAQREQYYAAVHKGVATPVRDLQCERIPEYADDISPYATFHVATQQVSTPQHIHSFVYHDQAIAAMETMPLKSTNLKDDYGKVRGGSKINKCLSTGSEYSGSTTDQWSEQGGIPRTERIPLHAYGGSHAGESSSSAEQSPVLERRAPHRHKHSRKDETGTFGFPARLEPPSGFSDGHEVSEAECDMESIHRLKSKHKGFRAKSRDRRSRFTIAV